jgi:hypothetical protein
MTSAQIFIRIGKAGFVQKKACGAAKLAKKEKTW